MTLSLSNIITIVLAYISIYLLWNSYDNVIVY